MESSQELIVNTSEEARLTISGDFTNPGDLAPRRVGKPASVAGGSSSGSSSVDDSHSRSFGSSDSINSPLRRRIFHGYNANTLCYKGISFNVAASQGNLPVCVLLWGIAASKKPPINLMQPDIHGNNPIHFAALADSTDVLAFLYQQTQGLQDNKARLLNSVNNIGETPLLRAVSIGKIPVIKALLEEHSDPFARDKYGNTIFIVAVKQNHLWSLHFMYSFLKSKVGVERAYELLCAKDNEGHGPIEWAADVGDVNMIEYLLRRGLDPSNFDACGRAALYWAVKSNRVAAVKFLLQCGCDPDVDDSKGVSPRKLSFLKNDAELALAMLTQSVSNGNGNGFHLQASTQDTQEMPVEGIRLDTTFSVNSYCSSAQRYVSFAIPHDKERPSVVFVAYYSVVVFAIWLLAIVMPWWSWLVMNFLLLMGFRYLLSKLHPLRDHAKESGARILLNNWEKVVSSQERYLGFWLGCLFASTLYIVCALYFLLIPKDDNPFAFGAVSGPRFHTGLAAFILVSIIVTFCLWVKLVFLNTDPGIIDTRSDDFENIMDLSLQVCGQPNINKFCRTTFVRKPIRSKYCVKTSAVIARFDHYCVWLNTTIGDGNHLLFLIFLGFHLLSAVLQVILLIVSINVELKDVSSCDIAPLLVSQKLFFPLTLCVFSILVSILLLCLTGDQLVNIKNNITVNEKLNMERYEYLIDDDGNFSNPFDLGICTNFLEFFKVPGYAVDYKSVFEVDSKFENSDKEHLNVVSTEEGDVSTAGNDLQSSRDYVVVDVSAT